MPWHVSTNKTPRAHQSRAGLGASSPFLNNSGAILQGDDVRPAASFELVDVGLGVEHEFLPIAVEANLEFFALRRGEPLSSRLPGDTVRISLNP